MADLGRFAWGPGRSQSYGGYLTYSLDDSNDAVMASLHAPRAGTITHVGLNIYAKVGSPPGYRGGVCAVETASGIPTSTPFPGSAFGDVSIAATGWQWVALDTAAVVSQGDLIGIYVGPTGAPGSPDGSNYITVLNSHSSSYIKQQFPTAWTYSTSAVTAGSPSGLGIRYSDDVVFGRLAILGTYDNFDSADTPDEVGAKFTLPYAMRAYGVRLGIKLAEANASYQVVLYDSSDTVLGTITILDEDLHDGVGIVEEFVFPSSISLLSDTVYRLTVKATHATSMINIPHFLWPDAYCKTAYHEGANWILTARTNGGAWTDSDGTAVLALMIDDITIGGSAPAAIAPRWL